MHTILIQNGLLFDGLGGEGVRGDLLLEGDRISAIGKDLREADEVIDAGGMVVCPGFIDLHRHCDATLLKPWKGTLFADAMLSQGITSIVVGNCGMSLTPAPEDPALMYDFMEPVLGCGCAALGVRSYGAYREALQKAKLPVNVASMVGTGSVKITVKGFSSDPYTEDELHRASHLIEDALMRGARGVSAGIMYLPECYSRTDEFAEILKPLGRLGGVLTAHIRGEGDSLCASVREIIEIGRKAGCPVEISHFKSCGIKNWRKGIHEAIGLIEEARASGQDVTCDFYPYTGGSTALTTMLPPVYVAGDMAGALKRLGTPEGVEEFRKKAQVLYDDFDNYAVTLGWERILISGVGNAANRKYLGFNVEEGAKKFGFPDACALAAHLMHSDNGKTSIINLSMCQEDVDAVAKLPYSLVISDSIYADTDTPHPRMFGSFPKFLREYGTGRKGLTFGQAIAKMTSMPANRMKLTDRGVLREGAFADISVFDPAVFRDHATFSEPQLLTTGLSCLFLNGRMVWRDGSACAYQEGRML